MREVISHDKSLTFANGKWHEGNPALLHPRDHGLWLGSAVFDGARSLGGALPDLLAHCQRLIKSGELMGLKSPVSADEIARLSREAVSNFHPESDLYICPLLYPSGGFIVPDPESTEFVLHVSISPLPEPRGFSSTITSFRRPALDMAPTEAKASCLYPNVARSIREANGKGFDTGISLDPAGNVAEFSYANLFMCEDGAVHTPVINGTFLNGITRQRIIQLLRADGIEVIERAIRPQELDGASELFASGNYAKLSPCIRLENRELGSGPIYNRARELYLKWAATCY
ncbi:MAG: branched chain amino acid aminotransferase [Rhodospirillaceae bacterium TMED8]|nr:branched chain amino acid aminotransferase [Magnetovibrio sp.]OUT52178.1 MAG: branched chain amino acid aminotransferase [Rhodospirillaceae bacterium TMED8]|tara:strand:+ start:179 stop:1039 length:861 start_codon:yes stop_codon:yes gene_type:complete